MEPRQKSTLENGIRVLTEEIPTLESVSIGVWITTGSRDENARENGLSHFIEHLLFKGTERRSAFDISRDIESVGGSINAFTSKECICLHAKVLHKDCALAVDILSDILANSVFDAQEIERERMVILQEIKMVEDTPDDYIHDLFHHSFWRDHPLGYPIIGVSDNVLSFNRDEIVAFFKQRYTPDRMIVAAAGRMDHHKVVGLIESSLGCLRASSSPLQRKTTDGGNERITIKQRELEQVHMCLGTRGIPYDHRLRFAAHTLNTILGGNMSSRLFQEIREKRGLTYNIYSFLNSYIDTGLFGVYAGTTTNEVEEVISLIVQELKAMRAGRIRSEDLVAAKEYLRGTMILNLEGSDGRMSRLAKDEIYFGRFMPLHEILQELERVSQQDIDDVTREMFDHGTLTLTLLGAIDEGRLPWKRLEL